MQKNDICLKNLSSHMGDHITYYLLISDKLIFVLKI